MRIFLDSQVDRFIASLEKPTIAKVLRTIDLLEEFGHKLSMPHSKKIDRQLFELRIRGKKEIRVIYTFYKYNVYLLHGFIKKSREIPQKELQQANTKLKRLTYYNL